jgi:hypothetical protein
MIFIDETSTDNKTHNRRYGYSLLGQPARHRGFFVRGKRYSSVAAIHETGLVGYDILEGTFDEEAFLSFVREHVVRSASRLEASGTLPPPLPGADVSPNIGRRPNSQQRQTTGDG